MALLLGREPPGDREDVIRRPNHLSRPCSRVCARCVQSASIESRISRLTRRSPRYVFGHSRVVGPCAPTPPRSGNDPLGSTGYPDAATGPDLEGERCGRRGKWGRGRLVEDHFFVQLARLSGGRVGPGRGAGGPPMSRNSRRRERLMERSGVCFWCGVEVVYVHAAEWAKGTMPANFATVDHLHDRLTYPGRQTPTASRGSGRCSPAWRATCAGTRSGIEQWRDGRRTAEGGGRRGPPFLPRNVQTRPLSKPPLPTPWHRAETPLPSWSPGPGSPRLGRG